MTRQQTLAALVRDSRTLLVRYLKGFDDSSAVAQAPSLPNHVLWTLGHLSITLYRAAAKLDDVPPPESVFIDGHVGDSIRFGADGVAYGSRPRPDASIYPPLERAREIFDDAIERFASAVERIDDATLDRQIVWATGTFSVWALISRMIFHSGTHCGQLADLRRALGMGSIFK